MKRSARLAQALAGSTIAAAFIIGSAAPAAAHADLVRSEPATGTTLERAPTEVRMFFSEPVDPTFTRVSVRGTGGFTAQPTRVAVARADGRALVVTLPRLAAGPYAITYTTTTTDGHTASGDVLIGVGRGAQLNSLGPAAAVGAGAGLRYAATVFRVVWYIGLGVLVGALVWGWLVPPREPGSDARRLVSRRVRRLVIIGWGVLLVATTLRAAVLLASLANASPGSGLPTIVGRLRPTTAGRAWFVLVDVTVLAAVVVRRDARRWLAATAVVLAVGEAATGHAPVGPHPVVAMVSVSLHLLALAIWGGGLVVLATLLASPAWRRLPGYKRQALLNQFLRRFSRLALGAVAVLLATGGVMAWVQLGGLHALTASGYGHVLLVKLALIAVVLPLGAWHALAGPGRERLERLRERARAGFPRTTAIEAVVVVAIVVVASVLASRTPGRVAASGASLAASARPTSPGACRKAAIETSECWQHYFTFVVNNKGPVAAVTELRAATRTSKVALSECHQLVHTIGRQSFDKLGSAQAALRYSTPLCNSGYQHGVIEEAISRLSSAELRSELPTFCTPGTQYRAYSFDHHNCTHGIGHGIATQKKEDVFASTPFCEVLTDPWEVQSCYGGVFMQKVIGDISGASTDPHADDPVWPCDVVPEIQKDSCYLISTGRVLRLVDYDWTQAFAVCDNVESAHVVTCYESMGRDISGFTNFEPVKMRDLCMNAGRLGPEPCIRGAVETTVDDEHGSVRATALCKALPPALAANCLRVRDEALSLL